MIENLILECETCGLDFDILCEKPSDIDLCIVESGHDGHKVNICDYEPSEHDPQSNR